MASDDPIRASDADREVVVDSLRDAYTAGRLDLDEFDERTSAAYESKTWGDLRRLTIDLPAQPILGGDVPGRPFAAKLPPGQLPVLPPRDSSMPPVRRGRPVGYLIPLFVWIVIMSHAPAGGGFGVLVVSTLVLVVIMSALRRR
jgi:hypothetical protein